MATCPQCDQELAATDTLIGPVPGCDGCGHLWLGAEQLRTLQATAPRSYVPDDVKLLRAECAARKDAAFQRPIVYFRCPGCDNQMLRRNFGAMSYLLLHYCADHGYWIHRDELEGIASYLARGGELLEMEKAQEMLEERLRRLEAKGFRVAEEGDSGGGFIPFS